MASVATAPNDSNDARSGTEKPEYGDEDNEGGDEDVDSDATVNLDLRNALLKNKELAKAIKILRAQYNRAVKLRDDNVRKHTQALENRRTMYDGLKTRHKTEVSLLKSTLKNKEKELRDAHRTVLVSKNVEIRLLKNDVGQLERDKIGTTQQIERLEVTVSRGQSSLTEVRASYAASDAA